MKLITRDTDYALRALSYIAGKKGDIVSVSELVKNLKIPKPFLRKLLQALNREKILKSYKGVGGGFTIARRPADIFLTDVIRVFQGPLRINECGFKKKLCPNRKDCPLKKKMDSIEKHVFSELSDINIAMLLKKG